MTGIDRKNQRRYLLSGGSEFIQGDAMAYLADVDFVRQFDFIHLSPPCQVFSPTSAFNPDDVWRHTDYVTPALRILKDQYSDIPWVMENVPEAPMYSRIDQILKLCGSSFPGHCGFDERRHLHRHRKFRLHGFKVPKSPCKHNGYKSIGVYGALNSSPPGGAEEPANFAEACKLMQIDWMKWDELKEAVPPAYSHYVTTAPGGLADLLAC